MASEPHSGHLDAELDRPEELTDERLAAIVHECLQRWDGFPTIPGSRRWSVNGKTALRELTRRRSSLKEQFDAWTDLTNWMWTIICNVSEGDWTKQSEVWQDAAANCREQYHALLKATPAAVPSEEPIRASRPDWASGEAVVSKCVFCQSTNVWEIGNAAWKCADCGAGGPGVVAYLPTNSPDA